MGHRFATNKSVRTLSPLPGCDQIVVSHSAFLLPEERGKGQAYSEHEAGLAEMRRLLYDYALCTVESKNGKQISVLNKAEWELLYTFKSKKTGNYVHIYGKLL